MSDETTLGIGAPQERVSAGTKLTDADREQLTNDLLDDLCGMQLVKYGLRGTAEKVIARRLADFEHTAIPAGPTWWDRMKLKLFGEARPEGT